MRSQATSVRGWFGLIRKGSGKVVGLARLIECGKPLNQEEMIAAFQHHRIPETMIRTGAVSKWVVPWKMADIRPLDRSLPYQHKSGAVTWVILDEDVSRELSAQIESTRVENSHAPVRTVEVTRTSATLTKQAVSTPPRRKVKPETSGRLSGEDRRVILRKPITGGSLRNKYVRLGECLHEFPHDTIGGGNKAAVAQRSLTVHWGGPTPTETDIAGDKSIFRNRAIMRQFIETSGAREGDVLVVSLSDPYTVHLSLERSFQA